MAAPTDPEAPRIERRGPGWYAAPPELTPEEQIAPGSTPVAPRLATAPRIGQEYAALQPRQRLAVVAGLSTAFIVLIGGLLLWRERRRPIGEAGLLRAAAAMRVTPRKPIGAPDATRQVIGRLGEAIRREAASAGEADVQALNGAVANGAAANGAAALPGAHAHKANGRAPAAHTLESYFAEIEALRRARRPSPRPNGAVQAEAPPSRPPVGTQRAVIDDTPAKPPRGWRRASFSGFTSARRRSEAQRRIARDGADPSPATQAPSSTVDREASIIHRVRELGRRETEARQRREAAALKRAAERAARQGSGPEV